MKNKKAPLDPGTAHLVKRLMQMPPKPHDAMKVGRPANSKKRRDPKGRDVSAKPRTV